MIAKLENDSGFSLAELMVTIAVIGILTIAATPYTLGWRLNQSAKYVATAITYDLQEAKSEAIKENKDVIVTFDIEDNSYQVYLESIDISNLISSNTIASLDAEITFGYNEGLGIDGEGITQEVRMGNTSEPIRCIFRPNGTANDSGEIYIIPTKDIGHENKRQKAIVISTNGRIARWEFSESEVVPWEEYL